MSFVYDKNQQWNIHPSANRAYDKTRGQCLLRLSVRDDKSMYSISSTTQPLSVVICFVLIVLWYLRAFLWFVHPYSSGFPLIKQSYGRPGANDAIRKEIGKIHCTNFLYIFLWMCYVYNTVPLHGRITDFGIPINSVLIRGLIPLTNFRSKSKCIGNIDVLLLLPVRSLHIC